MCLSTGRILVQKLWPTMLTSITKHPISDTTTNYLLAIFLVAILLLAVKLDAALNFTSGLRLEKKRQADVITLLTNMCACWVYNCVHWHSKEGTTVPIGLE